MVLSSWISPKTAKGLPSKISGKGFFATQDINNGEVVAIKAGHLIDRATLEANMDVIKHSQMQITDDIFIAPMSDEELEGSMIYFNHSCEPNLVVDGQIILVADRDIVAGEELTVDYGTIYSGNDEMECNCGASTCRHLISGHDWQKPELREKYGKNFAWFLLKKIENGNN